MPDIMVKEKVFISGYDSYSTALFTVSIGYTTSAGFFELHKDNIWLSTFGISLN